MSKPKQGRGLKDAFIELSFEQAEKHDELVQNSVELAEDNAVLEGVARELIGDNVGLTEEVDKINAKSRRVKGTAANTANADETVAVWMDMYEKVIAEPDNKNTKQEDIWDEVALRLKDTRHKRNARHMQAKINKMKKKISDA